MSPVELHRSEPLWLRRARRPWGCKAHLFGRYRLPGLLLVDHDLIALDHIDGIAIDTASILVRYESGDIGNFVVSWGLPPGVTPDGTPDTIFGPHGLIKVGYGITHQEARATQVDGQEELVHKSTQDMYQLEIEDFAQSILTNRSPKTTGQDGKAALAVALAAIESIKTGQPVSVG